MVQIIEENSLTKKLAKGRKGISRRGGRWGKRWTKKKTQILKC